MKRLLSEAEEDPTVLAVVLFGSQARGDTTPMSDTDVCVVFTGEQTFDDECYYAGFGTKKVDVSIFNHLPLRVQHEVFKDGKVLYCADEDAYYDLSFMVMKKHGDFHKYYKDYIESVL